jgi:hypothetical protein
MAIKASKQIKYFCVFVKYFFRRGGDENERQMQMKR